MPACQTVTPVTAPSELLPFNLTIHVTPVNNKRFKFVRARRYHGTDSSKTQNNKFVEPNFNNVTRA